MNKIQIGCFFVFFATCGQNNQSTDLRGPELKHDLVVETISKGFRKYDSPHFTRQDSCAFMSYITHDYRPLETSRSYRYSDDFFFISNSCPITNFGFSILKRIDETMPLYYGHSDVYHLRYSSDSDEGKITHFSNISLEDLLNKTISTDLTGQNHVDMLKINTFLYYLYFENIFKDVSHQVFIRRLRLRELLSRYNVPVNEYIISNDFKNLSDDNVVIFENPEVGVFIFAIQISNASRISIKEYIILSETRQIYFRADGLPNAYYYDTCR